MKAEFTTKLEGVKLDAEARKRIALGLQDLVVHELARIDHKGDLLITRPLKCPRHL